MTEAPPPFAIIKTSGKSFSTAKKDNMTGLIKFDLSDYVDLSKYVELPVNRIVIIQDVVNNPGNQGSASYKITSLQQVQHDNTWGDRRFPRAGSSPPQLRCAAGW